MTIDKVPIKGGPTATGLRTAKLSDRTCDVGPRIRYPVTRVGPGETAEHTERWRLYEDVVINEWSDAGLGRLLLPLLA